MRCTIGIPPDSLEVSYIFKLACDMRLYANQFVFVMLSLMLPKIFITCIFAGQIVFRTENSYKTHLEKLVRGPISVHAHSC